MKLIQKIAEKKGIIIKGFLYGMTGALTGVLFHSIIGSFLSKNK